MGEGGESLEFVGVLNATALLRQFLVHLNFHILQVLVACPPVQNELNMLGNVAGGAAVAAGRRGRGHDGGRRSLLLLMMMVGRRRQRNAVAAWRDVMLQSRQGFRCVAVPVAG